MTDRTPEIQTVFVDSDGLHDSKLETLDKLHVALGAAALDPTTNITEADAMIIMGGDGAFLHAVRRHDFADIPVTGINTGTLGFYMDTLPTEAGLERMATSLKTGAFCVKQLPLLQVRVGETRGYAINEVVVGRESLQAFKASLQLGKGEFDHFVGDAFIFTTPQGSTSYALSAGGPILQEGLEAYAVVPSNPHRSHNYYSLGSPAVVSGDTEARLQIQEVAKRPYIVSVDDVVLDSTDQEEVTVRIASDKKLQIIRFDDHDYFQHVSATFRGKRP